MCVCGLIHWKCMEVIKHSISVLLWICFSVFPSGVCEIAACIRSRQVCGTPAPHLNMHRPSHRHPIPTYASPMWPQPPRPSGSHSTKVGTTSSGVSGWQSTSAASNASMPCWTTFPKRLADWSQICDEGISFEADCTVDAAVLNFNLFNSATAFTLLS